MSITSTLAGATGLPAIPEYLAISKNEQMMAQKYAQSTPQVKSDLAYFQKQAPKLTTVPALMKDYRSLGVVLNAFNMSAEIAYPGLVTKLITQDPTSASSLANTMGNPDYKRFATAMAQYKTNPFASATNLTAVTNAYVLNSYEANQGQQIPGMQDALAFKRQAAQVTSIAQLMSNTSLLKVAVAQTGLDWSTFGVMQYDQQVKLTDPDDQARGLPEWREGRQDGRTVPAHRRPEPERMVRCPDHEQQFRRVAAEQRHDLRPDPECAEREFERLVQLEPSAVVVRVRKLNPCTQAPVRPSTASSWRITRRTSLSAV